MRRAIVALLVIAGLSQVGVAIAAVASGAVPVTVTAIATAIGIGALWAAGTLAAHHFTALDRLRHAVIVATSRRAALPVQFDDTDTDRLAAVLQGALSGSREAARPTSLPPMPPPASEAISDALPLSGLPGLVLDSETTGLDPVRDRIVALGAVRLHGPHILDDGMLDLLVAPGMPIPPGATAVHGITDAMVDDAPDLAQVWPDLLSRLEGVVVIGHNIGFDLAILRRQAREAGLTWSPPPALDTLQLVAALEPKRSQLDLDAIAADYGISLEGRHTALGDCLITAELFVRLIPLLAERGVVTLGAARAFAAKAWNVVALQRQAGW